MPSRYENKDMTGAVFSYVNLAEAVFEDASLAGARFSNVNLGGATIQDANLSGLKIESAAINGLTIFGIAVDELIEHELDRRDPARAALRMQDTCDTVEVRRVMERLDHLRTAFHETLRQTPQEALTAHPGPDRWSALEHARHLVFAEDMYLNRWLLRNDNPWCKLGFLPPFLESNPAFAEVGQEPTDDLETVLAAWDEIHQGLQALLPSLTSADLRRDTSDIDFGQGTVGAILQGMAQHDLVHIRMAEAALRDTQA